MSTYVQSPIIRDHWISPNETFFSIFYLSVAISWPVHVEHLVRAPYKVVVRTCFVSRWRLATFVISRRKTGSNFCHGFFTERKFRIQVERETRVHVRTRNTTGERKERVDFYTSCWIHDRLRRSIISREKDRGNPHGEHVRQRGRRTLVKEPFNRIR